MDDILALPAATCGAIDRLSALYTEACTLKSALEDLAVPLMAKLAEDTQSRSAAASASICGAHHSLRNNLPWTMPTWMEEFNKIEKLLLLSQPFHLQQNMDRCETFLRAVQHHARRHYQASDRIHRILESILGQVVTQTVETASLERRLQALCGGRYLDGQYAEEERLEAQCIVYATGGLRICGPVP